VWQRWFAAADDTEDGGIYWDDQLVNVGALTQGAVPADPIDFGPGGIYTRPKAYGFGVGEDMDGTLQFSHRYREGTDINFHVHWAPASALGGYVKWELSYYWLNVGQRAGVGPTVITAESPAGPASWEHKITAFSDIAGAGKLISSIIIFKIKRIAATSGSDLAADAAMLSIDAHFQIDAPGSRQMLVK
jgi:hypothetical protein